MQSFFNVKVGHHESAITLDVIVDIEQLHRDGVSIEDICRFTGRTNDLVATILGGRHQLQTNAPPKAKRSLRINSRSAVMAIVGERAANPIVGRGQFFEPTPQQIEEACQAIRATWSEDERYSRREVTPEPVSKPIVHPLDFENE